jgi:hypothetical protein
MQSGVVETGADQGAFSDPGLPLHDENSPPVPAKELRKEPELPVPAEERTMFRPLGVFF